MQLTQKLLFVMGKGGVGRSTVSAALGLSLARRGERTLLVQWAIRDHLSSLFGKEPAGHRHQELRENLFVMNYAADEAVREYFVEHLGMRLFYKFIIENNQVRRLIHAAPGFEELFFLGRLFWLAELADRQDLIFDRIVVDAPATGHGGALFGVASTVGSFQFSGPLISESQRVTRMLDDPEKTGHIVVTLPEELPVDETLELIPKLKRETGRNPLLLVVNRSLSASFADSGLEGRLSDLREPDWFSRWKAELGSDDARIGAEALLADLRRRVAMEGRLRDEVPLPIISLPDLLISSPLAAPEERIARLVDFFENSRRTPEEGETREAQEAKRRHE